MGIGWVYQEGLGHCDTVQVWTSVWSDTDL